MPTPTPDEIAAAAAQSAADGIESASVDGRTSTAMDPVKQLEIADKLATRAAMAGANATGGAVSGWSRVRMAKAVPPGGS